MKCLNCDNSISMRAKYCSDKCRMAYARANKQPEQTQPEHEQTAPEQTTRTDSVPSIPKETRNCAGVHAPDKCLSKQDWKEIHEDQLNANELYKICNTNYTPHTT